MIGDRDGVRRIQRDERATVLDTVVRAFRTDPLMRWFFEGDDEVWARQAVVFFAALIDVRLEGGEGWQAGGGAAVALWDPPGGCLLPGEVTGPVWDGVWRYLGSDAHDRVTAYADAVERLAPPEPRWYLGVLATHPDQQRRGLASAVVRPVLDGADRAGLPAYLETATEANVRFYATLGFEIRGEVTPTADAPHIWVLERKPRISR